MPLADALAVWADEGRVIKHENNGEPLIRRYQPLVSEWSNPTLCKQGDHVHLLNVGGTWWTETSK